MACEDIELAKLVLQALIATVAIFGFLVGLQQYRRAQLWKRKEFISAEVKSFEASPMVRNAFLMIDWSTRHIPLDLKVDGGPGSKVTRPVQISALAPHLLRPPPERIDAETYVRYTEDEAMIRDAYDAFLDGFGRLGSFAQAGLYEAEELLPYVGYWVKDVTSERGSNDDRRWRLALFAYIHFYGFSDAQDLFGRLGYDIRVNGPIWARLRSADTPLAERLEQACNSDRSEDPRNADAPSAGETGPVAHPLTDNTH